MPIYPKTVEELKNNFETLKTEKYWDWERTSSSGIGRGVEKIINFDSSEKQKSGFSEKNQDYFTVFSFAKSNHQANEAVNKFWSSLELLYSASSRHSFSRRFTPHYTIGSVGPTLYYACITSLISNLALFGCISLRQSKDEDYFLIRRKNDWNLIKKKTFITNDLRLGTSGRWHENLVYTYEGLIKNKVELPIIDFTKLKELMSIREKCHYRFLNECSMADNYREVLPAIINKIPFVEKTISDNLELIKSVRHISKKGLIERFKSLKDNTHNIYNNLNIFPDGITNNSKQQKLV